MARYIVLARLEGEDLRQLAAIEINGGPAAIRALFPDAPEGVEALIAVPEHNWLEVEVQEEERTPVLRMKRRDVPTGRAHVIPGQTEIPSEEE